MNRIQFWVLTGLSSVVVLFLLLQVLFARASAYEQARLMQAQQIVTEGRTCETRVRQLAARIYQVSQQTQDQALKDLLTRQQITVTPPPAGAAPSAVPASAPAPANP